MFFRTVPESSRFSSLSEHVSPPRLPHSIGDICTEIHATLEHFVVTKINQTFFDGDSILVIRPRKLSSFGFGFSHSRNPRKSAMDAKLWSPLVMAGDDLVLRLVSPSCFGRKVRFQSSLTFNVCIIPGLQFPRSSARWGCLSRGGSYHRVPGRRATYFRAAFSFSGKLNEEDFGAPEPGFI